MVSLTIDQIEAIDKFLTDVINKIGEKHDMIGYTYFHENFMKCKRARIMELRKELRMVR